MTMFERGGEVNELVEETIALVNISFYVRFLRRTFQYFHHLMNFAENKKC
jgi:hypothetical protein